MPTLDLSMYHPSPKVERLRGKQDALDRAEVGRFVLEHFRSDFSRVRVFHGTRLPNLDAIRADGLRLMTPAAMTEVVAPLWEGLDRQAIESSLVSTARLTPPYGPRICCVVDRRVFDDQGCNSFASRGPECLRHACYLLENGGHCTSAVALADKLLGWPGGIVYVRVPLDAFPGSTLQHMANEVALQVLYNEQEAINITVNFMCDIDPEWIERIESV